MEHLENPVPERRTFMKWCIHGLSAVFTVVLGAPAIAYLIDPLNRPKPANDFRTVDGIGRLSDLKEGLPIQGVIRNVRHDAWTLHPNDVVGRVWVVKETGGKVQVFTTVCPHLGCSVNSTPAGQFACPCHGAKFDIHGVPIEGGERENPAPRGMDTQESKPDENDPEVLLVKYENFRQGQKKKELRS